MSRDYSKLSDTQILDLAGNLGPGIIGQELFDLASKIRTRTDNGRFGPALLDSDYGLDISPWDEYSRRDLLAIAREHELPVKSNASRDDIAKALVKAKKLPDADEGNAGANPGDEGEED
jgi:hypothetical protein